MLSSYELLSKSQINVLNGWLICSVISGFAFAALTLHFVSSFLVARVCIPVHCG